jgi:phospholipid/cholesterol/gamma-HCH transport system substrate-binding protein
MFKRIETELKVGIFVITGIGLFMVAILFLGGNQNWFSSSYTYTSHFDHVDGLIAGAKVILNGVPVGTVEKISFDKTLRNVQVQFSVDKDSGDWIRKDSTVEIATQGILGDKYISVNAGSEAQPIAPPKSDIPNKPTQDISHFLSKGDQLMVSLNSIAVSLDHILKTFNAKDRSETFFRGMSESAKNLSEATDKLNRELDHIPIKSAVSNLNHIFEKVNNGTGTVGALINDPGLYDALKALMGGANRNRIIRNLVRQTIKDSPEAPEPEPSPKK